MITVYTKKEHIEKDKKLIQFVDLTFNKLAYDMKLNQLDTEYMRKIDGASYLGDGKMETVFGTTWITNLSTGCKVLILLNHYGKNKDYVINIGECGQNALDEVFKLSDCNILMEFKNKPMEYDKNKKILLKKATTNKELTLVEFFSKGWK